MHIQERRAGVEPSAEWQNQHERVDRAEHGRSVYIRGRVPIRCSTDSNRSHSGQLSMHLVQGCEFMSHGFGFDVLIGRDILCKGILTLSFDGHYLLCF
jgi:hypothetical protein